MTVENRDLSDGARKTVDHVIRLAQRFTPGELTVTENYHPKKYRDEEPELVVEDEVVLLPSNPAACDITFLCCAERTGFMVWRQDRLAAFASLKRLPIVGASDYSIDSHPEKLSFEQITMIFDAVSKGDIDTSIGLIAGCLVATEMEVRVRQPLPWDMNFGSQGEMWLVAAMRLLKCGAIRKVEARPW